jgi:hypothetical protein
MAVSNTPPSPGQERIEAIALRLEAQAAHAGSWFSRAVMLLVAQFIRDVGKALGRGAAENQAGHAAQPAPSSQTLRHPAPAARAKATAEQAARGPRHTRPKAAPAKAPPAPEPAFPLRERMGERARPARTPESEAPLTQLSPTLVGGLAATTGPPFWAHDKPAPWHVQYVTIS